MDLDTAAEELYAGSPDDFVERRTALAAEARAARDRPLVKQILALRRPTRTGWLLNLLARECRDEVAALLDLGTALQDAQRRMAGPELRQLSGERRRLVDRLAREAVQRGAAHGYTAPDAALQEISQSLQAAMADPATGEQLRSGRLTGAVSYGGFGPSDLMAAMAASMPTAAAEPGRAPLAAVPDLDPAPASGVEPEPEPAAGPEPEPEPSAEERAAEEERRRRAERVAATEAAWQSARAALDEAETAANDATAHADELADRIEELRAELEQVQTEEATAREAARAARRRNVEARRAAAAAGHARDAALRQQAARG